MTRPTIETIDEARQGETSGHMRWVLFWTIALTSPPSAQRGWRSSDPVDAVDRRSKIYR